MQQLTATECGAACLAMVLAYHGKTVPLDEVRTIMGVGRDGATALAILDAASWYGLRGRGVKLELEELRVAAAGRPSCTGSSTTSSSSSGCAAAAIEIVDPALGRRRVSLEQFGRSFTGVALLLEPSDTFAPNAARARAPSGSSCANIIAESGQWSRIIVISLLVQLFALALPLLTGAVVDRVVPRGDVHLLVVLGVGWPGWSASTSWRRWCARTC